jgi:hypothetical protein
MTESMLTALPVGDLAASFTAIQVRNLDAFAAAARAGSESLSALVSRQSDILQTTLRSALARTETVPADSAARIAQPFDALKTAVLENTANMNVLSQMLAESNAKIATILQDRLLAALEETKAALQRATPASGAA